MAVDVETEILIECPLDKVAAYVSDSDNAPHWYVNIQSVEWKTVKEVKVGSQMEFIANFLGRQLIYTYEIVDFVPQKRLAMRTAEGPFPMETQYLWEPVSSTTTCMKLRNSG